MQPTRPPRPASKYYRGLENQNRVMGAILYYSYNIRTPPQTSIGNNQGPDSRVWRYAGCANERCRQCMETRSQKTFTKSDTKPESSCTRYFKAYTTPQPPYTTLMDKFQNDRLFYTLHCVHEASCEPSTCQRCSALPEDQLWPCLPVACFVMKALAMGLRFSVQSFRPSTHPQ